MNIQDLVVNCPKSIVLEKELGKELEVYGVLVYMAHPCETGLQNWWPDQFTASQVYLIDPIHGGKNPKKNPGSQPYMRWVYSWGTSPLTLTITGSSLRRIEINRKSILGWGQIQKFVGPLREAGQFQVCCEKAKHLEELMQTTNNFLDQDTSLCSLSSWLEQE